MNKTAYLSEEILKSEHAIWYFLIEIYHNLEGATWLLGESYIKTIQLNSKIESECGRDFCYRKSLNEKQICKPGKLFSRICYEKVYIRLKRSRICKNRNLKKHKFRSKSFEKQQEQMRMIFSE